MLHPGYFSGLNFLRSNVEHDHVLVEVVEVASVALVPVVGELSGLVPVGINPTVVAVDAEGIMVEHGADDAACLHAVALAVGELDCRRVGESKARPRALPERNLLGLLKPSILVMERVGLEEDVGGGAEVSMHHDVLEIARAEPLHPSDVEQGGHAGHTTDGDGHLIGGVADKIGIDDSIRGCERLAVLLVKAIQQVDAPGVASSGVGSGAVHVVERLGHHVVDGAHDEIVKGNRHALFDLIEKHGQEAVELGCAGEGLIQGLLLDRPLDLERRHLVEELDVDVGFVEHIGVVGGAVRQIPAFVLRSDRETGADLLQDGTVPPVVHEDGGGRTGVGPIHEDDLADVVDEGSDEPIERVGVEDRVASVDDAVEILRDQIVLTEGLGERVVDDLVNLFYFHVFFSFQFSSLDLSSNEIDDSDFVGRRDCQAKNVTGCDDVGSLFPCDDGNRRTGSPGHVAIRREGGLAGVESRDAFVINSSDRLLRGCIEIDPGAVDYNVTNMSHFVYLLN